LIYCATLAGFFLYLALARDESRYAIGVFGMFVLSHHPCLQRALHRRNHAAHLGEPTNLASMS
jgi:hypothetical protein